MVEPYHPFRTQIRFQAPLNLCLRERLVAVWRHQTAGRGEDGALAVALYRAALKDKVQMVLVGALDQSPVVEVTVDGIVELRLELLAPAVETEVEEGFGLMAVGCSCVPLVASVLRPSGLLAFGC